MSIADTITRFYLLLILIFVQKNPHNAKCCWTLRRYASLPYKNIVATPLLLWTYGELNPGLVHAMDAFYR